MISIVLASLTLLSGPANVVPLTESLLNHEQPSVELAVYFKPDKVALFQQTLNEYGPITMVNCEQNHDSASFDTVACYIRYDSYPSGVVWEFYYFLEEDGWVGTNLGVIQILPEDICPQAIAFIHALGKGIDYDEASCRTNK